MAVLEVLFMWQTVIELFGLGKSIGSPSAIELYFSPSSKAPLVAIIFIIYLGSFVHQIVYFTKFIIPQTVSTDFS